MNPPPSSPPFFFFNDTATTEIYTLSLHDALPIYAATRRRLTPCPQRSQRVREQAHGGRSEEHTSELQSPDHLVCRLLLEKKKKTRTAICVAHSSSNSFPAFTLHCSTITAADSSTN